MKSHWSRDPSLHFALIGAVLFGINSFFSSSDSIENNDIVVSESRINHLAAVFERGWQRPPEPQELEGLINDYVREEVLYREAIRQGLDKNDTVIRRRLRMKMEFLARDLVEAIEPADALLQEYYQKHIDRYTQPAQYSFEQIFLDSDKRPQVAEDARIVLTKLVAGADYRELGDNNLLQHHFSKISSERIDRVFGGSFSLQLTELPQEQWVGPLTSAYGEHLVRITSYQPEQFPEFAEIRTDVLRDWQIEEQKKILETQYNTLRANYQIQIASPSREVAGP
ncbi:peptidyl-prolyl cis-trans isomerase [Microbulbifer aggregans]|uniref:peptidylprolyl isomerase n=1 Tax=Microbulbifer aggregans TaxID=1769779 RepID=UPI001CFE510F|nr:peptidylprolyl isomerase [Microbulbifer aggregans]